MLYEYPWRTAAQIFIRESSIPTDELSATYLLFLPFLRRIQCQAASAVSSWDYDLVASYTSRDALKLGLF